jgi:1-acyl-sn-glycerol-3-phosphate acyltransferase
MLRLAFIGAAFVSVTTALLPLQALAVACRMPLRRAIPRLYHRFVCRLIGLRIHVTGARVPQHPLLIVANHSSWLDICIIASVAPVIFITKREVADWPLIGLLARLQRSVFVDRKRRQKTGEVTSQIAQRLVDGDPVVLFAEGTSSDGNRVLPFRSALIGAARDALTGTDVAHVFVQPLSIAYVGHYGLPLGRQDRHGVAWYGGADLLPHLKNILRRGEIDVTLTWGEPVLYDHHSDRKQIAKALETTVRRMTVNALRAA